VKARLRALAGSYHATITYKELGEEVQKVTGIKMRVLLMNWIGQVPGGVSRESHLKGQPLLSPEPAPAGPVFGANFGPALVLIFASVSSARRSGMARSRVELFEQIRRDQRAGDLRSGSWLGSIMCTGGRRG
jgi:hypothetical protein